VETLGSLTELSLRARPRWDEWLTSVCLLAWCAIAVMTLGGCRHHYMDVAGPVQRFGVLPPGVEVLYIRLVDSRDRLALPGVKVSILSRDSRIDLLSDDSGFIRFPLSDRLADENPVVIIHRKAPTTLLWNVTVTSLHKKNADASYVTTEGKDAITTEGFEIYYMPQCQSDVHAVREELERQQELIREVTGLRPAQWGVIIVPEDDDPVVRVVRQDKPELTLWCYSSGDLSDGKFARVNIHEWTEHTLDSVLGLGQADERNRFILDGLAEYVAFRHTGVAPDDLETLRALRARGVRFVNLLKEFRVVSWRPGGVNDLDLRNVLQTQGYPPGYPLSFIVWYDLCEAHGAGLPAILLERLKEEKHRTAHVAVKLIEEITGRRDIRSRLTQANVDYALETLEALSGHREMCTSGSDERSATVQGAPRETCSEVP